MTYRVDLTQRAARNLRRTYQAINVENVAQARTWFNGLEKTILSLDEHPARGAIIAEEDSLRHLFYGRRRHIYRIIWDCLKIGGEAGSVGRCRPWEWPNS